MEHQTLKGIIETLLFITDKPLSPAKIADLVDDKDVKASAVAEIIAELRDEYADRSALELREIAGGWQFATAATYSEYVRRLYRERTALRLSPASLETLAIVAYRQPVTKAEIEETRGVDSTSVLDTLVERKLVRVVGRKEIPGRPWVYGTTAEFLKYFGIASLADLPPVDQFLETGETDAGTGTSDDPAGVGTDAPAVQEGIPTDETVSGSAPIAETGAQHGDPDDVTDGPLSDAGNSEESSPAS
jgi:segregation and condensation protein B